MIMLQDVRKTLQSLKDAQRRTGPVAEHGQSSPPVKQYKGLATHINLLALLVANHHLD